MKIGVIGLGYVGLSTSLGLSEIGHQVFGYEIDQKKLDLIKNGKMPLYEEGLQEILNKNLFKNFFPSGEVKDVLKETIAVYICVPTPSNEDGSINLSYVKNVAETIGPYLAVLENKPIVIIKSTVVPGTTREIRNIILKEANLNKDDLKIAMIPEFLKQGAAFKDFMFPDRIIFGIEKKDKIEDIFLKMYEKINSKKIFVDIETAEFSKYASNSFLALKISFANELANLVDTFNLLDKERAVNVDKIVELMGLDNRINSKFLGAGPGYGGSCFPKDVKALSSFGRLVNNPIRLLEVLTQVNENQPKIIIEKAKKILGSLENKKIGIFGLAFKPNTDDIRETPAKPIIDLLLDEKALIYAWDPKAEVNMKKIVQNITYHDLIYEFENDNLDLGIILTDWQEIKDYFENKDVLPYPIFDTRRIGLKTNYNLGAMKYNN